MDTPANKTVAINISLKRQSIPIYNYLGLFLSDICGTSDNISTAIDSETGNYVFNRSFIYRSITRMATRNKKEIFFIRVVKSPRHGHLMNINYHNFI